eukprot:1941884-Prymnesium_polylepis.1
MLDFDVRVCRVPAGRTCTEWETFCCEICHRTTCTFVLCFSTTPPSRTCPAVVCRALMTAPRPATPRLSSK